VPRGVDCRAPAISSAWLDIGQDLRAAIVISLADLGQTDLSRGAMEQPRAEPLLQRLDVIAHHGGRHVEAAGGGGKPATVDDPDKRRQAGQPIHRRLRLSSRSG
jgi:hypothetical protein